MPLKETKSTRNNPGGVKVEKPKAEQSVDPATGNDPEGPSAQGTNNALGASQAQQDIITAKTTEASPEIAPAIPRDSAWQPDALDQSDSSEVGQGTTESYTTGQSDHHNDHVQTIDPVTGQGMTRAELRELQARREEK